MLVVTTRASPTHYQGSSLPSTAPQRVPGWVHLGQAQTLLTTPNLLLSAEMIPTWVCSACRREGGKDIHTHRCHKSQPLQRVSVKNGF